MNDKSIYWSPSFHLNLGPHFSSSSTTTPAPAGTGAPGPWGPGWTFRRRLRRRRRKVHCDECRPWKRRRNRKGLKNVCVVYDITISMAWSVCFNYLVCWMIFWINQMNYWIIVWSLKASFTFTSTINNTGKWGLNQQKTAWEIPKPTGGFDEKIV